LKGRRVIDLKSSFLALAQKKPGAQPATEATKNTMMTGCIKRSVLETVYSGRLSTHHTASLVEELENIAGWAETDGLGKHMLP
jgi:hypothetical protein